MIIKQFFKRIEDFLIPPLCVVCDSALGDDDRWLCPACLDKLKINHASRAACPRCSQNRGKRECACEFAWDYPFEKVFSIYDYDDTLSSIARHIKYKGKKNLAYHIGVISAPLIPQDFFDGADMVIPVPLHKARLRSRGYNQAEWFARGVLSVLGGGFGVDGGDSGSNCNNCNDDNNSNNGDSGDNNKMSLRTDILKRIKNTGTQTKLDREERQENLAGAFSVDPSNVPDLKDRVIVVVDDIFTTGATTEACVEELIRNGCSSARVLSLGRD